MVRIDTIISENPRGKREVEWLHDFISPKKAYISLKTGDDLTFNYGVCLPA